MIVFIKQLVRGENNMRKQGLRQRVAYELCAMRKEGFDIPRNVSADELGVDENMTRIELRDAIASVYNYITPSGEVISGLDALYIMNNTIKKQKGARYHG